MNYLLDTNAVSALLKGRVPHVRRRYEAALAANARPIMSVVVYHELYFGALRSANPENSLKRLTVFLQDFGPIVEFTPEDARIAADIRTHLAPKGLSIGPYDTLIAAQALSLDATLVTGNVREFARVPGLKWEDWSVEMA